MVSPSRRFSIYDVGIASNKAKRANITPARTARRADDVIE
jgi:hypothetical protein